MNLSKYKPAHRTWIRKVLTDAVTNAVSGLLATALVSAAHLLF
ncbi:DUF6408 family protein [Streptomyces morookaense]